MDFELSAEERALAETVRHFVDTRVEPRMREIEARNQIPEELFTEAAQLGLFGISIPEEFGGSGLSRLSRVLVHQMLGRSGFGFAGALASHTGIGSDALVSIGTEEQKRRYLPRMATGELRAAFAITEPGAGSDAGSVRTRARKEGDRYYLNGIKHFISGGSRAGVITVVARTGGEGSSSDRLCRCVFSLSCSLLSSPRRAEIFLFRSSIFSSVLPSSAEFLLILLSSCCNSVTTCPRLYRVLFR